MGAPQLFVATSMTRTGDWNLLCTYGMLAMAVETGPADSVLAMSETLIQKRLVVVSIGCGKALVANGTAELLRYQTVIVAIVLF